MWSNVELVNSRYDIDGKLDFIEFKYTNKAVEMLKRHLESRSRIVIHTDIDVDGIASLYILYKYIKYMYKNSITILTNRGRNHGIESDQVDYINETIKPELVIILDSSTNEVDLIERLCCDVIVVDHHEVLHNRLEGKTRYDGDYLIVTNMAECTNVDNAEHMSAGMVLYELLRVFDAKYNTHKVLVTLKLYQWVVVSLLSDSIILNCERNIRYLKSTLNKRDMEPTLKTLLEVANKYKFMLDKSAINYSIAPLINKAIRAGAIDEVVDTIINNPKNAEKLKAYSEKQADVIKKCSQEGVVNEDYIVEDLTDKGIDEAYCGVVATNLAGNHNKNTACFVSLGDVVKGSFRGRVSGVDYRKYFEDYKDGVYAQGHKAAFGFRVSLEDLQGIMARISEIEPKEKSFKLTAGRIGDNIKGTMHIEDMGDFKKSGKLVKLAIANSLLSTGEEYNIITSLDEVKFIGQRGKLLEYNVLGLNCKAFGEGIKTKLVQVYVEYANGGVEAYVRNMNGGVGA